MILDTSIKDDDEGEVVGQCSESDVVKISYVILDV